MRLWLANYKLMTKSTGQERQGYLLKIQTDSFAAGYADIFPWPEFGDPEFLIIPKIIKEKHGSALLNRSLEFAIRDGEARANQKTLTEGQALSNHCLITDIEDSGELKIRKAFDLGFEKIKIKVCRNKKREINFLRKLIPEVNRQSWLPLRIPL